MSTSVAPSQALRAQYRAQYRAHKAQLLQTIAAPTSSARAVRGVLRKLSALTDHVLRQLWHHAGLQAPCALLAVGGFGRAELFPYSDIDVLVLLPQGTALDADAPLQKRIENFIGSCWDAGLEISSSVRTVHECIAEAAKDITVQTALLESRHIVGSAALTRAFHQAFFQALDPWAFFNAKTLEMQQRHNQFENTPYALEPNCKESPGGLRDLQMLLWVAQAAGYGKTWKALQRNGLATPFEIRQLQRNEALLIHIRTRLHLLAQRREDRLLYNLQDAVAEKLGYSTSGPHTSKKTGKAGETGESETAEKTSRRSLSQRKHLRASEVLMKHYYWAAKAVSQLNQILRMNIEERLHPSTQGVQPIDAWFKDKAGLLDICSDTLYQREPQAILQTFWIYQSSAGMRGLSARTLRALYNARGQMNRNFRTDPRNRATLRQILQHPTGVARTLELMNQTSVLGRYLWVFRRIVGQMQHDLFHAYTVDQHILMVVRKLQRFFVVEYAHETPYAELASGWGAPWVLYIAALFHDIAKGRHGDHSALGAKEARRFCQHHGIQPEDSALIEFLVREHLLMSHTAQKMDLSDPQVIAHFTARVGTQRRLTALYLLTVADIRGTSPKVWNAWKGKLLADLYQHSTRLLGGQMPNAQGDAAITQKEALAHLALYAMPLEAHTALWNTLDLDYFMRHDADDIAWHTRQLAHQVHSPTPVVRARRSPAGEGLQVLVYTPDQPDLFARICGYFDKAGWGIVHARIYTTQAHYALDTFQVDTSAVLDEHYRETISRLENTLTVALARTSALPAPSQARGSRRVQSFPLVPRVSLQADEQGQRWLLSISASDRIGLLYAIARVLAQHHITVQLAKINTWGERVEDSFVIHAQQLQHGPTAIAIETQLLQALN